MARPVSCGDLIKISRRGAINYQHWAIYVGDGDVIHLVKDPEHTNAGSIKERIVEAVEHGNAQSIREMLVGEDKATVKREKLEDVVGQDKYSFNNHLDGLYKPRPIQEIMEKAKSCVGERFPYNLLENNCEHFVTLLRYGKPESQQVQKVNTTWKHYVNALIAAAVLFGIKGLAMCILKN